VFSSDCFENIDEIAVAGLDLTKTKRRPYFSPFKMSVPGQPSLEPYRKDSILEKPASCNRPIQ
jgi:hypothetical protein